MTYQRVELPTKYHPPLRFLLLVRADPFDQLGESNELPVNRDQLLARIGQLGHPHSGLHALIDTTQREPHHVGILGIQRNE